MHWIVQKNLHREEGFAQLIETLERFGINHDIVDIVPFSDGLPLSEQVMPVVTPTGPVMCIGAVRMSKIAREQGWTPGTFHNEFHDYRHWLENWGEHLLNHDSITCAYGAVDDRWPEFFVRPCEDTKSFTGRVITYEELANRRDEGLSPDEKIVRALSLDTMVSYGPVKDILCEVRCFVVDGRVVTHSLYKLGQRMMVSEHVDEDIIAFAQSMVDIWQPARAFVIDVAVVQQGEGFEQAAHKIVEVNCLNSAGFYAADIQKLVAAIESMDF